MGADYVIDYTAEDFTRSTERYDLIFDMAASRALREMKRVLSDDGFILTNSGHGGMRYFLKSALAGAVSRKVRTMPVARLTSEDLSVLAGMIDAGTLRPVIDRTLGFEDIPTGLDYVAKAHARGKVVAELIPG